MHPGCEADADQETIGGLDITVRRNAFGRQVDSFEIEDVEGETEDAARAMILAVASMSGHTLGQVLARVKSLPGFHLAGAQFEAQGGAAAHVHGGVVQRFDAFHGEPL